jgi:hypothetical protein
MVTSRKILPASGVQDRTVILDDTSRRNGIPRCSGCGGPVHPLPLFSIRICPACRERARCEAEHGIAALVAWLGERRRP